jgi:DNA invertase Pin-like site-specific DNA recombinase
MTRIWLAYIRKSVVRDDTDLESPERQLSNIRKALEITENDPYTIKVFQDLDRSGISEEGREGWLNLKAELDTPGVVGVIGNSLDRLYRNVYEFLKFIDELERRGLVLRTAKEFLDTSNPLGRFVVTILMAMYEMESRLTSVRMRDMIEDKRRNQGRHWGGVPFGCDRDENGQLIPTQKTYILEDETRYFFDALTECFKLYAQGTFSYEQVADLLNVAGWRFFDRYGKVGEWNEERVRGVVGRWRLYQGQLPLGNPIKDKGLEYVEGGHSPILPAELCQAVSVVLASRTKKWWPHPGETARKRIYLLSDFTFCDFCQGKLVGQFDEWGKKRVYRHKETKRGRCSEKWVVAQDLEKELLTHLIQIKDHPQIFDDLKADVARLSSPQPINPVNQTETIEEKLSRLEDVYINEGAISKESYLKRRTELLSELARLQPSDLAEVDAGPDLSDLFLSHLYMMEDCVDTTRKALLSKMIDRLGVTGGKVHSLIPAEWAKPFFDSFVRIYDGPGGSRTHVTRKDLILVDWLNNANLPQDSEV